MANRAIVAGCDAYPHLPGADLTGAVADALAVREWLLMPEGGAVPRERLTFLASPSDAGARPGPGEAVGPASLAAFARATWEAITDPGAGAADRLYVYLAGHGCRTDPLNPVLAQDAFAFTGFDEYAPGASCVTVSDLLVRLRQSRFGEIVLILDACRDFPFQRPFSVAGLGFDLAPALGRPYEPQVYVLQATLPGRQATGKAQAGKGITRGDFTMALLAALGGDGRAKAYEEGADRPYVVRWSGLTSYVEAAVPAQEPRGSGEGDLLLASFPDGYFDPVRLTVVVEPDAAGHDAALRVRVWWADPAAPIDPEKIEPGPAPVGFDVPPRRQHVVAQAGTDWGRADPDVYANATVVVPVRPGGPRREQVTGGPVYRGGAAAGAVQVTTDDPAAVLRVSDASGRQALWGVGQASGALAPGSYTATLIGAAGRRVQEPFDIEAGSVTRVPMTAPEPAPSRLRFAGAELPPGSLWWASDAAALAWSIATGQFPSSADLHGEFTLAIAGAWDEPFPRAHGFAAPERSLGPRTGIIPGYGLAEQDLLPPASARPPAAGSWWGAVVPRDHHDSNGPYERASWLTARLGEHTLTIPMLPNAATVVALGHERASVALYDDLALRSPVTLALLDRGQSLLAAGESWGARSVLTALQWADRADPWQGPGAGGWIATRALLRAAEGDAQTHGLAAAVSPVDAARLLPTGPWAAFVDQPLGQVPVDAGVATYIV